MKRTVVSILLITLLGAAAAGAAEPPELRFAELGDLELESGEMIRGARVGYRTLGALDPERSNAVLFPTWFSGTSADLFRFGAVGMVDTSELHLIVVDALGNGVSSSPSTSTSQPGPAFPRITIGDMVSSQRRLLELLGIERLHAVVGISMGGMQTFEWITAHPGLVERAVPIVGSPRLDAYDILLWQTQLEAIALGHEAGNEAAAKALVGMIGQLALQTPGYHARQTGHENAATLVTQAKAGGVRMDLEDRAVQLRAMIDHDVGRRFGGSFERAAAVVQAEVLNVVGAHDHMVTPGPALGFAELIGAGSLVLESDCGHLASSCEPERVERVVRGFLARSSDR